MSRCISTSLIGLPRIRALPAVGKISLISSLMVVDLPAPFGPIKPNTSPVSTCMFSPSRDVFFLRCRNPKGYSLVRFSTSIAQEEDVRGKRIQTRRQLRSDRPKSGGATPLPDLHQLRLLGCRRRHRHRLEVLRVAPIIQYPHLLHARNRALRRAKLLGGVLAVAHLRRVLCQRNPRISALLRAPMHH